MAGKGIRSANSTDTRKTTNSNVASGLGANIGANAGWTKKGE